MVMKRTMSSMVDVVTADEVKEHAEKLSMSPSKMIAWILKEYCEAHREKPAGQKVG
jgi:Mn-dependent DtxR family transcriptional regulator